MRVIIPTNVKSILSKIHDTNEFLNYVEDHFRKTDKSLVKMLMAKMISTKYDGSCNMQEHFLEMTNFVK